MELWNTVSHAASAAYGAVVRRNRQAAVNNRLKAIVRGELGTINRAYIALGKYYYNELRDQARGDQALLCSTIDQAKERIQKAQEQLTVEKAEKPIWEDAQKKKTSFPEEQEDPGEETIPTESAGESPVRYPFAAPVREAEDDAEAEDAFKIQEAPEGPGK